VLRKSLILGVAAACLLTAAASAQTPVMLMPGVTYEQSVEFTPHGPVVLHVVRAPRPGGLYAVRPQPANDTVLGREPPTALQQRLAPQATSVSVSGDVAAVSGLLLRDGVLDHAPASGRSSAVVDAQGTLHVGRVSFAATWRGTGQRRPLNGVDAEPAGGQVVLFTSTWGGTTPRAADAVDAVLSPFPPAALDSDLSGTVTQLVPGGGTAIPPGGAVLQARGTAIAQKLQEEAPVGTTVTARLTLQPAWPGPAQGFGGGPILVRNGKAIFRANEAFDSDLLLPRAPRTAIGQLADGRILLVAVDGGQAGFSVGMSNFELALALQRLGAVWATAQASGDGAALAFDGALLSRPPGREQPVASTISVAYTGVYALALQLPVTAFTYRLVRPSTVHATLTGPDGTTVVLDDGPRDPGTYSLPFAGSDAATEGTWRFAVTATDDRGLASSADRSFVLDRTLGPLRLDPTLVRVGKQGGSLTVSTDLTRPAQLTLQIETAGGVVVAAAKGQAAAGTAAVRWNGRTVDGQPARSGRYVAHLFARSEVGTSDQQVAFTVRRVAGK
jgi:hypothetical protein